MNAMCVRINKDTPVIRMAQSSSLNVLTAIVGRPIKSIDTCNAGLLRCTISALAFLATCAPKRE